jgi:hypothetical protein
MTWVFFYLYKNSLFKSFTTEHNNQKIKLLAVANFHTSIKMLTDELSALWNILYMTGISVMEVSQVQIYKTYTSSLYWISIMLHPNRKLGGSAGRGIPWSALVLVLPRGTEPLMSLSISVLTVRDSSWLWKFVVCRKRMTNNVKKFVRPHNSTTWCLGRACLIDCFLPLMERQININSNNWRYLQLFEDIINWINARYNVI